MPNHHHRLLLNRKSREIEKKKKKKKKRYIRILAQYHRHNFKRRIARLQHKARIRSINSTLSLLVIINSGINGVAAISVEQKSAISVKLRRSSSRGTPVNSQKLDFLRKQHPFQHRFPDEFPHSVHLEAEREKTWPNIMEHSGSRERQPSYSLSARN